MSGTNRLIKSTLVGASDSTLASALLNANEEAKKKDPKKGKKEEK